MTADSFPCFLPGCAIDLIEQNEQGLIIAAHVSSSTANCPTCEQSSRRVHSFYERLSRDLPVGEHAVRIRGLLRHLLHQIRDVGTRDVGYLQLAEHWDDVALAVAPVRMDGRWLVTALRVVGDEPVEEFFDRRRLPGRGPLGAGIDATANLG